MASALSKDSRWRSSTFVVDEFFSSQAVRERLSASFFIKENLSFMDFDEDDHDPREKNTH